MIDTNIIIAVVALVSASIGHFASNRNNKDNVTVKTVEIMLNTANSQTQGIIAQQAGDIKELRAELGDVRDQLSTQAGKQEEREKSHAREKASYEKKITGLQKEVTEIKAKMNQSNVDHDKAMEQRDHEHASELTEKDVQIAELKADIVGLENRVGGRRSSDS